MGSGAAMLDLRYHPFVALVVHSTAPALLEIGESVTCLELPVFAWHSTLNPLCATDICSCHLRMARTTGAHTAPANAT